MLKRLPLLFAVLAPVLWLSGYIFRTNLALSLIAYGESEATRDLAVRLAPDHSHVLAARGKYLLYRAEPPRPEEALRDLQVAVRRSPFDYRFRIELGRAYENTGRIREAESELVRALQMAPRYFEPRWALANLRLRAGRIDEALDDFRSALDLAQPRGLETTEAYGEKAALTAFVAVTGALGNNLDALKRITPPDPAMQAYLAGFLAEHDFLDQALEMIERQPARDDRSYRGAINRILVEVNERGRFKDARILWQKLLALEGVDAGNPTELMTDPGFERKPLEGRPDIRASRAGFDWVMNPHAEVRARRTGLEKRSGNNSLHVSFAISMRSEFRNISQLIAVEPSRTYRLSYWVRAKNIPVAPGETPYLELADAAEPGLFVLRSAIPPETYGWREQSLGFTTPAQTRGLRLTVCSPQVRLVDPLKIAELWLDDFSLAESR